MNKLVIIPDSFKGTMSSREVGNIIKEEALKCWPGITVINAEVADGGEGSVDAFFSVLPGKKINTLVKGPYGEKVESFYGLIDDVAVIEMAAAAGLPLVGEKKSVGKTTTFGVGELILDALKYNVKKIILGLGGSATNDGGTGVAAALGIKFLDNNNKCFIPTGDTLCNISKIDVSGKDPRLENVEIVLMCDVENTLCGENGASAVFGPQKGASIDDVLRLDKGLRHMANQIKEDIGLDILDLEGGGAAGGMGAGLAAFLGASLQKGIEVVLDTIHFDEMLKDCSLVITGEGRIDRQSVGGKAVSGITRRASSKNVPVIVVAGDIADDIDAIYEIGVKAVFSINRMAIPFAEAKHRAQSDLQKTVGTIFNFIKLAQKLD